MYVYDDNVVFSANENRIAFLIDSPADIPNLPTTTQPGLNQGLNNVSNEPVDAGSVAFAISTSRVYMLNSEDQWILQPEQGSGGGGGGGATNLTDLEDVSLGTLRDQDFLVYNSAAATWTNKKGSDVVVNYSNATSKPTINGITLDGDLTSEDLGIDEPLTIDQINALLDLI